MVTASSAGDARGWQVNDVLTAWAVSCRWISSKLQALPRCTWWLVISVVGLGAFMGDGRGVIGPEETLDDSLISTVATTKAAVVLLVGDVEVPSLHPIPCPGEDQNLLRLGGDGTVCVVSFLKAPPRAFGCSFRETAGGGDGTSDRRWCSYWRSGVASDTSATTGLGSMEQRGLDGGRVMIDEHMMVALSGVVVASTVGRTGEVDASVQL
ncbi:hypothetical protein D1007_34817 [Hordeum vulgare]|nr:hypothetical protein D1007_34817 [Hordeum vulgare]